MANTSEIFKIIKENEIEFVDFCFTGPKGNCSRISYMASQVSEAILKNGVNFDGSSVKGWKSIDQSDMLLMPDMESIYIDQFTSNPTIVIFCDVYDPRTGTNYNRDPRSTALKAENYLKACGIGDTAYFGPELEFFVFDDIRFKSTMNETYLYIDSEEGPYNTGRTFEGGNTGHRPHVKGAYLAVQPIDYLADIRAEMMLMMRAVGLSPTLHHHEVAPSQCEVGFDYSTLVKCADNVQKCKYVVHNVAASYNKTATFMAKPIRGDNGSGMHVHQSIWQGKTNLFVGKEYSGLSETSLYYIGGIIKHARAINAFTNPTTNSYKRLVPGYEAPVLLAYSAGNRSASIRIPFVSSDNAKRIEARFPDPTANPYYAFAAMLMAGIDGIKNKIHPGDAIDKNLYELPKAELAKVPSVSPSLRDSLKALNDDRAFLTAGDVFDNEQIDSYIQVKLEEADDIDLTPHPLEYQMYYSS